MELVECAKCDRGNKYSAWYAAYEGKYRGCFIRGYGNGDTKAEAKANAPEDYNNEKTKIDDKYYS
jgi:hypothetical protein